MSCWPWTPFNNTLDFMSSNYYDESMSNPLALALSQSPTPDQMYARTFAYFQSVFRRHPQADVRRTNILAHDLPEGIRGDRRMMGATMTGAIAAILDHEAKCGVLGDVPAPLLPQLDEVIIEQGAITGVALLTSDLVLSRVSEWERTDLRNYKRWLQGLDKAARIHQRKKAAPLNDPLLAVVKPLAVEQLRPVVSRLQERFAKQRRTPTPEKIVEAFDEETRGPDVPFLSHEHNRQLWLTFYRRDPVAYLHFSPERLWDEFTGFVTTHKPGYVRKEVSKLTQKVEG
jgi:hypothetical protein